MLRRLIVTCVLFGALIGSGAFSTDGAWAAEECQAFPITSKAVCGRFLQYWREQGGLAQQGYPISDPFMEKGAQNGKTYLVQYFERARFEYHPENSPPYDVILGLLGAERGDIRGGGSG